MSALDHLLDTLQVRVLVAQRAVLLSGWPVAEHVLPCNKIYFAYKGEGWFTLDERTITVRTGEVNILPVKRRNRCWQNEKNRLEKLWIHFDARVLGLVDLFDVIPAPPSLRVSKDDGIQDLLETLVAEFQNPAAFQSLALNGLLTQALAKILRKAGADKVRGKGVVVRGPGDRIGSVLQFVAQHYAEELTLDDLAKVVHLHPTYFSNTFRKATGVAPMAFLQQFRVERAKGLLATTDLPVMEVAQRVGFADPYHFSRVFKKFAGSAPSVFQESVRSTGAH